MIVEVPAVAHASIGWRIAAFSTGLVALAMDIYLGLSWLDRDRDSGAAKPGVANQVRQWIRRRSAAKDWVGKPVVVELSRNRDRSAMLTHLFWQHWRQSAWLMFALPAMWVAVLLALTVQFDGKPPQSAFQWLLIGGGALVGCAVFRSDQERRNYRFFVEHNIPARYVWLSRQVFWGVAFLIAAVAIWLIAIAPGWFQQIKFRDYRLYDDTWLGMEFLREDLPLAMLCVAVAAVAYATGQWVSMLVRSGVIAAVVAVALAIPLCGWVELMHEMQISYWWSVLPIPVVLLFATWLRAPDWVVENRRWSARVRAAVVLLVPAATLCIAMPIYRVHQVPPLSPKFDDENAFPKASMESAPSTELVRWASDLVAMSRGKLTDDKWLADNQKPLALALEASSKPKFEFNDPLTSDRPTPLRAPELIGLSIASGRQLQMQGKLDEAFDRLLTTLRLACQLDMTDEPREETKKYDNRIYSQFVDWAAEKGQTPERIKAAVKRLSEIDVDALRLDERVEWYYVCARHRLLDGDGVFSDVVYRRNSSESEIRWMTLMPWERERAVRMLNLLTSTSLDRLHTMEKRIAKRQEIVHYVATNRWWNVGYPGYFEVRLARNDWSERNEKAQTMADWLTSTCPRYLDQFGYIGLETASALARFETLRRAALIRMALISWRLKHGKLPNALGELVPEYFSEMPVDPYSARQFQYYADGVPPGHVSNVASDFDFTWDGSANLVVGERGIWSSGPRLVPTTVIDNDKEKPWYSLREWRGADMERVTIWQLGLWFPIPEQKK